MRHSDDVAFRKALAYVGGVVWAVGRRLGGGRGLCELREGSEGGVVGRRGRR